MLRLLKFVAFIAGTIPAVGFAGPPTPYSLLLDFEGVGYEMTTFLTPYATPTEQWPRILVPSSDSFRNFHDFTLAPGMADSADGQQLGLNNYNAWLTSSHKVSGERSLGTVLYGSSPYPVDALDKLVVHLFKHSGPEAMDVVSNGARRYVSYYMKFAHNYDVPDAGIHNAFNIHMQVWQCCGYPPPLAMYIKPKNNKRDDVELVFVVRDSNSLNQRINYLFAPDDQQDFLYAKAIAGRFTVARDEWRHFTFQFVPSPNGDGLDGQFAVWVDGQRRFVYKGDWGYTEDLTATPVITRKMGMNIGNYRLRHDVKQFVFFDDVKMGGNYSDHQ